MATSAVSILSAGRLTKPSFSLVNAKSGKDAVTDIKITKVSIKYSSRPQRHTREDGTTVVDVRTIDPIQVTVDLIAPGSDQLKALNDMLADRDNTYNMTSKSLLVNDLVCSNLDLKQSPDMLSATPLRLSMKQILRQGEKSTLQAHQVVEQPADSSVSGRGIQTAKPADESLEAFTSKVEQSIITAVPLPPLP